MENPAALFGRHRERDLEASKAYRGPTYYDQPALKPSPWDWRVASYIFIAGLAGSAQIIATIADVFGGSKMRSVVQKGRHLALAGAVAGPPFIIADLKTPKRWYNMLRIFRPTSPMSIGSYLLTTFGATSSVTAAAGLLEQKIGSDTARAVARVAQVPAALSGAGMSFYTAALLSATSTPLWAVAPKLLATRFACSSMATGAAALSLVQQIDGEPESSHELDKVALVATAAELAVSVAEQRVYEASGVDAPLHEGNTGRAHTYGALALGVVIPVACYAANAIARKPSRGLSIAASLAVLAGGMAMRQAILYGGKESACRPRDYFRITSQERVPERRRMRYR